MSHHSDSSEGKTRISRSQGKETQVSRTTCRHWEVITSKKKERGKEQEDRKMGTVLAIHHKREMGE